MMSSGWDRRDGCGKYLALRIRLSPAGSRLRYAGSSVCPAMLWIGGQGGVILEPSPLIA